MSSRMGDVIAVIVRITVDLNGDQGSGGGGTGRCRNRCSGAPPG